MSSALVVVDSLFVDYDGAPALKGVSLEVERGEVLALVGGSGSGKSTLARTLLRLGRSPAAGSITYDGRSVYDMSRSELAAFRGRAQIVFQDPEASLNPRLTVGAAIGEALVVHGFDPGPKVPELLEMVGMEAFHADRFPHQLSGGQRQRVSIARALAVQPEFLVLDEPLSALDVSIQAQILILLRELRDEHDLTYLFISHDLAVVERLADRVAVMEAGVVVESGPCADVFGAPREAYTRRLVASIPRASRHP